MSDTLEIQDVELDYPQRVDEIFVEYMVDRFEKINEGGRQKFKNFLYLLKQNQPYNWDIFFLHHYKALGGSDRDRALKIQGIASTVMHSMLKKESEKNGLIYPLCDKEELEGMLGEARRMREAQIRYYCNQEIKKYNLDQNSIGDRIEAFKKNTDIYQREFDPSTRYWDYNFLHIFNGYLPINYRLDVAWHFIFCAVFYGGLTFSVSLGGFLGFRSGGLSGLVYGTYNIFAYIIEFVGVVAGFSYLTTMAIGQGKLLERQKDFEKALVALFMITILALVHHSHV